MTTPSITIVIASLYEDDALRQSVNACLAQVGVKLQVIISLKADRDTPQVESNLDGNHAVVTVRRKDQGIAEAWNYAIDHVSSDYVSFLGAGDHYFSQHSLSALFDDIPDLSASNVVIYGDQSILHPDGSIDSFPSMPAHRVKQALKGNMVIPHASSLWPATLFRRFRFDETFRIAIDYEYALRMLPMVNYHYVATPVAIITTGGVSNRPSSLMQVVAEDVRAKRQNGYFPYTSLYLNAKRILRWSINLAK